MLEEQFEYHKFKEGSLCVVGIDTTNSTAVLWYANWKVDVDVRGQTMAVARSNFFELETSRQTAKPVSTIDQNTIIETDLV